MNEDLVPHVLPKDESNFKLDQIKTFNKLLISEPSNTILLPLQAELPTATSPRVKALMSGSLTTFFELSENMGGE